MQLGEKLLPVIMAGVSGTRLWQLSHELYSKQFLSIVDSQTMLQNTIWRLAGLPADKAISGSFDLISFFDEVFFT